MSPTRLFGTDGIRGRAYEPPLDEGTVRRLGASLASNLGNNIPRPDFLLAGDTRESTVALAEWLGGGIQAEGATVTWGGILPTPAVSLLLRDGSWHAGIVISASHNPAADNGIKVLDGDGEKIPRALEQTLEAGLLDAQEVAGPRLPPRRNDLAERYRESLLASLPTSRPLGGMRIVLDAANGAASGLAEEVLRELGANVTSIASSPDGTNINAGVGAAFPDALAAAVASCDCDGGLALDGDADRAVLVDENGAILDGDDILLAWARALKQYDQLPQNRVVATVMSNFGLEVALRAEGMELVRCPVGDREVRRAMVEHGATLGGEQSGHIICSQFGVTGDGILTGIQLLSQAAASGRPLSALSDLKRLPQILLNVHVGARRPFEGLPAVMATLGQAEETLGDRGRVLLRYSGTEPLARVMLEGEEEAEITELANAIADSIRRSL